MPILSLPGPLAAFIAFGRAKVWPILVLSSLIFSPLSVSASCESDLISEAARPARFVDFAKLERLSDAQIAEAAARQESLRAELKAEQNKVNEAYAAKLEEAGGHNARPADLKAAGVDVLLKKMERMNSDLAAVENFKDALARVKDRRGFALSAAAAIAPLKIEIDVRGKSERDVLNQIVAKLRTLNQPLERLVLRYYSNARHDLAALYGTDNHGARRGHRALWDDQGLLTGVLDELNLQRDDGFHGAPPEFFFFDHEESEKIADGIGRIAEFMNGGQAISVYDADQLIDYESDFYIFKTPAEKAKAVRAILLPVNR